MARTAPVPNIPAIPGMNPGAFVMGGGGGGGGGSGKGGSGTGGKQGADGSDGSYAECGTAAHPIDVVTGRAFTHPCEDLQLPGPLLFLFERSYSTAVAHRDVGLGFGWTHSFGWQLELRRREVVAWSDKGVATKFPKIKDGERILGPWGWELSRCGDTYTLDRNDGAFRHFGPVPTDDESQARATRPSSRCHKLTSMTDRYGNRIALRYERGALHTLVDSVGREIRVCPDAGGRIGGLEVRDENAGHWVTFTRYHYDERGDLRSVTDADGFTSRYEYDDCHRLTADTDRCGLRFSFEYDAQGRCVASWGEYQDRVDPSLAGGLSDTLYDEKTPARGIHQVRMEYNDDGYREVVDSLQVRRYFGNDHGLLDKLIDGAGVWSFVYNDAGHLLAHTDPLGATTRFDRDNRGRLLGVISPLQRRTQITRDDMGLITEIVDAAGGQTVIQRDEQGSAIVFINALGETTTTTFNQHGFFETIHHPNGGTTRCGYDRHANLIELILPDGAVWRYTYDAFGRLTGDIGPDGSSMRFRYSPRGDLIGITDADGGQCTIEYDGEGRVVRAVRPSGYAERYVWGGYHKLCDVVQADGSTVKLRYNREGDLVELWDELDQLHRFEYDPTGKQIAEHHPSGSLYFTRDAVDRVVKVVRNDGVEELTLDLEGSVIQREQPDGSVETYEYDENGLLAGATNNDTSVRITRDALGRVVREEQSAGGAVHWVETSHDATGYASERRTSLGYHERIERDVMGSRMKTHLPGGRMLRHWFNQRGLEVGRSFGVDTLERTFDALGRLTTVCAGNTRKRPTDGQPQWVGAAYHDALVAIHFGYDADGEVSSIHDKTQGQQELSYDGCGRLLQVRTGGEVHEAYRYDRLGNTYSTAPSATEQGFGVDGRLIMRGNAKFGFDDLGRREICERPNATGEAEITKYQWDGVGMLRRATLPDGDIIELTYDALGRRLLKRVLRGGVTSVPEVVATTRFVWDGHVLVHEIQDGTGDAVLSTYLFEDSTFEPMLHLRGPVSTACSEHAATMYVNDVSGFPRALLDGEGHLVGELRRSAFGVTEQEGTTQSYTPLRLQGQYDDDEMGLHYTHFRYFEPSSGTFVSADPIGLLARTNFFGWPVNPISGLDPFGLDWNYRLREAGPGGPGTGRVYYHGRASDNETPASVMARHAGTSGTDGSRFGPTDRMEVVTPPGTSRSVARGVEQRGIAQGQTNIGRRSCNGGNVRGNNIRGVNLTNPRRQRYQRASATYLRDNGHAGGNVLNMPALSVGTTPTATPTTQHRRP